MLTMYYTPGCAGTFYILPFKARGTGREVSPINQSAEVKMAMAARQIKAVMPSVAVLMYNPVFPVVDW